MSGTTELWSIPRPYTYTLTATVTDCASTTLDSINVTVGYRTLEYRANPGV